MNAVSHILLILAILIILAILNISFMSSDCIAMDRTIDVKNSTKETLFLGSKYGIKTCSLKAKGPTCYQFMFKGFVYYIFEGQGDSKPIGLAAGLSQHDSADQEIKQAIDDNYGSGSLLHFWRPALKQSLLTGLRKWDHPLISLPVPPPQL